MTVSDDMLSAFLDAELSDEDMEYVRTAIANDLALSDRLASLAQVDMMVKASADVATQKPLPSSLVSMLADDDTSGAYNDNQQFDADGASLSSAGISSLESSALSSDNMESNSVNSAAASNVTPLNWKKSQSKGAGKWKAPLSLAAGVALVAGLTLMQSEQTVPVGSSSSLTASNNHWANVSNALDHNLAGEALVTVTGMEIVPQLSFINDQTQLCRQAQIESADGLNVMIACKNEQGIWQLHASKLMTVGRDKSEYQTASANKALDEEIDLLMVSTPLNREQEQQAIDRGWQSDTAKGVINEN
ncbi:anti-sigma factor [Alteromonas sp. 1_MG-2023]|uniref:anti-sigma factor n=1 Tax=Alteromonas sp. 1_MG-2023 TaxID=3062669 RepID=UPI0026E307AA|nr:anti-sigma factor [Alteromonas sp. 1_MG-2023]MDO6567013.1 anti-sigma factor [Alteromonas sp. 1_MG-2023]